MKERQLTRKAILTVEAYPDSDYAVKVNGALVTECKSFTDVEDFIDRWKVGAATFRHGYEIRGTPIPAVRKRNSPQRTAAGKLLQDDALAAETYLASAAQSLVNNHGWTDAQVLALCAYALQNDYGAIKERKQLPAIRTSLKKTRWFGLFG